MTGADSQVDLRLWLIRHGETEHNKNGVFQGQLDTQLTETGLNQARQTGEGLANVPFSLIYASDLARAADTAREVARMGDLEVRLDPRLREIHYGVLQGVAYTEFKSVLSEHGLSAEWGGGLFSKDGIAPPGGESLSQLQERLSEFLDDLIASGQGNGDIGIVAHGGTIRTMLTMFLDLPPTARDKFGLSNCGVSLITRRSDNWRIEFLNRVFWS